MGDYSVEDTKTNEESNFVIFPQNYRQKASLLSFPLNTI